MDWLTRNGLFALDLQGDRNLISAIAVLDRELDGDAIDADLDDVIEALDALAYGLAGASRVEALLKARDLDPESLGADWKKLREGVLEILPESYQMLGLPLGALVAQDDRDRLVEWEIIDTGERSAATSLADIQIGLTGGAALALSFEANPGTLPSAYPPALPKPQVGVGLNGKILAGAKAATPIPWGRLSAAADGGVDARLDWYFFNRPNALFAAALVRDLGRLCSPFDLEEIAALTSTVQSGRTVAPKLAAIRMNVGGQLSWGGEIEVTNPVAMALGSAVISLRVVFTARRAGAFRYLVYDEQGLVVSIHRERSQGRSNSTEFGVVLDLKPLYNRFGPFLADGLGRVADVLKKIEDALPSDEKLKAALRKRVDKALGDSQNASLYKALIGFDGQRTASEVLADLIQSEVETSTARWAAQAQDAASGVADRLLIHLGIEGPRAGELRDLIAAEAEKAIDHETKRLNSAVAKVAEGPDAKALAEDLNSLGYKVRKTVSNAGQWVDEVFVPLRETLSRYQKRVQELRGLLEKAADAKFKTSFYSREESTEGLALTAKLRFQTINPESKELFRQIMTGDMGPAFTAARTAPQGGPVQLLEGELAKTARLDRESGYSIALFGLGLSGSRLLDTDVSYTVGHDGDIQVLSRGEIRACREAWREGRCLRFVNVYDLATAQARRRLNLSLTLSQADESVSTSDVRGFFGALEMGGLLRRGATAGAMSYLDRLENQKPGAARKGRLETGFALDHGAVRTLMGLDRTGSLTRPDQDVFEVVVDELLPAARAATWFFEKTISEARLRVIEEYFPHLEPALPRDVKAAILVTDKPTWNRARNSAHLVTEDGFTQMSIEEAVDAVYDYHVYASHLVAMMGTLRDVYLSGENPGRWTQDDYQRAQEQLDHYLEFWLNVDRRWFFLLPERIRPFTIAFIRVLARLAGMRPGVAETNLVSARLVLGSDVHDLTAQ